MKLTKETKNLVREIGKNNLSEWKFFKSLVKKIVFKKH